jgi:hypothetical protein
LALYWSSCSRLLMDCTGSPTRPSTGLEPGLHLLPVTSLAGSSLKLFTPRRPSRGSLAEPRAGLGLEPMREPPSARCLPAAQHRKSATEPRGCPGGPGRGKMYCHGAQLRDSRPGCRRGAAVGGVSRAHPPTVYVRSAGGWLPGRSRLDEAARNRSSLAYSEVRESGGKLATSSSREAQTSSKVGRSQRQSEQLAGD